MSDYVVEIPVLKVTQPIGDFFIASMPAETLVEIAYADVRRLVAEERDIERYLGIQRPVSNRRIKQIKKYIEGSDATFPTAVIVAVDEKCAEYKETSEAGGVLTLRAYEPQHGDGDDAIPWRQIAKVLDGQHRIAAFMDEDNQFEFMGGDEEFDINLSIFIGADLSEQANIFATVNLAQTKVNKSLVYDLTELASTRSPHRTCHNVAVMLDREEGSPLYQRIKRLGTATPGRTREPITQAAFVESLVKFISVDPADDRNRLLDGERLKKASLDDLAKCPFRNLFIRGQDVDIAEIIFNYFIAVKKKWPKSWDDLATQGNILPKSNAFKALMKFLLLDVYPDIVGDDYGEVPTTKQFYKYFKNIDMKDSDFTSQVFIPGSGGQATFLKMLRCQITREEMLE